MNYTEWLNHEFSSGCYIGDDYRKFQKQMKADLKRNVSRYGMSLHSFLGNHYEFSAVVEKNGKFAYVRISDVRFFKNHWFNQVLFRTMQHDKDWTGGRNQYCTWTELPECLNSLLEQ